MLKRIVAVAALGLAVGLSACDQGGQEQAQTPNRSQEQRQAPPPAAQPSPPSSAPSQTAPAPEQAPAQPPSGSGSGNQ